MARRPGSTLVLLLVPALCAWDGPGRFSGPAPEGRLGPAVEQVRALARPAYAVRGALFQLRAELAAAAEPALAPGIEPLRRLPAADAGWLAWQLERAAAAEPDAAGRLLDEAAEALASRTVSADAVRGALRGWLDEARLRPGPAPAMGAEARARLGANPAARGRLAAAARRLVEAAARARTAWDQAPAAGREAAVAAFDLFRQASRGLRGDTLALVEAARELFAAASVLRPLVSTLRALPEVAEQVERESQSLSEALRGLEAQIPDVRDAAALGTIRLAIPQDKIAELVSALEERLGRPDGPQPAPGEAEPPPSRVRTVLSRIKRAADAARRELERPDDAR